MRTGMPRGTQRLCGTRGLTGDIRRPVIRPTPDWLMHYGVQGQKWGVRNGPPYPIGSGPKGGSFLTQNLNPAFTTQEQREEFCKSLQKSVADWKYGITVNGKQVTDGNQIDSLMQAGKYKVAKPEESEKARCGICWDTTAYIDKALNANNVPHTNVFWQDGKTGQTHTFTLFSGDGKPLGTTKSLRWMESSWDDHKGIHNVKSVWDVVGQLNQYYNVPWPQAFNAYTFTYPASNWTGLKPQDFMTRIYTNGSQLINN